MSDMGHGGEKDAGLEPVQIFAEGSFTEGTLTWGWQCFRCRAEKTGFGSATTAGEGRDNHAALGCVTPPTVIPDDDPGCGLCGSPLTDDSGYTGWVAYHRECARQVYGDTFDETTVTPPTEGDA